MSFISDKILVEFSIFYDRLGKTILPSQHWEFLISLISNRSRYGLRIHTVHSRTTCTSMNRSLVPWRVSTPATAPWTKRENTLYLSRIDHLMWQYSPWVGGRNFKTLIHFMRTTIHMKKDNTFSSIIHVSVLYFNADSLRCESCTVRVAFEFNYKADMVICCILYNVFMLFFLCVYCRFSYLLYLKYRSVLKMYYSR